MTRWSTPVCALVLLLLAACGGKSSEAQEPAPDNNAAPTEPAATEPAPPEEPAAPTTFAASEDCASLCKSYVGCEGWSGEDGAALTGQAAIDSCVGLCDAPPEGTTFDTARDCLMESTSCDAFKACESE